MLLRAQHPGTGTSIRGLPSQGFSPWISARTGRVTGLNACLSLAAPAHSASPKCEARAVADHSPQSLVS